MAVRLFIGWSRAFNCSLSCSVAFLLFIGRDQLCLSWSWGVRSGTITKVKEFEIQPRIVDTVFTAAGFWKMTKDWIHVYKMTINFITADRAPIVREAELSARCVMPKCIEMYCVMPKCSVKFSALHYLRKILRRFLKFLSFVERYDSHGPTWRAGLGVC